MKRTLFGLVAGIAMAGTFVAAQGQAPAAPPSQPAPGQREPAPAQPPAAPAPAVQSEMQKPAEISITGCLVQGSGPTVFILENAKTSTASADKGKRYILDVASGAGVSFRPELNHQVTIVGMADNRTTGMEVNRAVPDNRTAPAVGQTMTEKDLPKFSAKTIVKIADTCPAAS